MKRTYLLLALFLSTFMHAQHYYPMLDSLNIWTYTGNTIPLSPPHRQTASLTCGYGAIMMNGTTQVYSLNDSVISSKLYKILYRHDNYTSICYMGLIREDTALKRVYFLDNLGSPEIILYDFSMQIGDSIHLISNGGNHCFPTATYRLDSIGQIHIKAGWRRLFHLNCHSCSTNVPSLEWVESVGNRGDALYTCSAIGSGGSLFWCPDYPHRMSQIMTCFSHQSMVYYDTCAFAAASQNLCIYYQDTCDYWNICGGIKELSSLNHWSLSPNPASSQVRIELDVSTHDDFEVRILDLTGKQVMRIIPLGHLDAGTREKELNISELENGLYLIECRSHLGSAYKKLVVQR